MTAAAQSLSRAYEHLPDQLVLGAAPRMERLDVQLRRMLCPISSAALCSVLSQTRLSSMLQHERAECQQLRSQLQEETAAKVRGVSFDVPSLFFIQLLLVGSIFVCIYVCMFFFKYVFI